MASVSEREVCHAIRGRESALVDQGNRLKVVIQWGGHGDPQKRARTTASSLRPTEMSTDWQSWFRPQIKPSTSRMMPALTGWQQKKAQWHGSTGSDSRHWIFSFINAKGRDMPVEDITPIKTEGFAFPTNTAFPVTHGDHEPGLSKREWFAGMAMMGLLARDDEQDIADDAVHFADALIAELAK